MCSSYISIVRNSRAVVKRRLGSSYNKRGVKSHCLHTITIPRGHRSVLRKCLTVTILFAWLSYWPYLNKIREQELREGRILSSECTLICSSYDYVTVLRASGLSG